MRKNSIDVEDRGNHATASLMNVLVTTTNSGRTAYLIVEPKNLWYDELVRSQLPKQAPDCVVGLQNTKNFDTLLSPVRLELARDEDDMVSDILQVTPFKSQSDPLLLPFLLPFLLLEAKSETSPNGFDAIQVQSAFPIHALLQLQEGLRSYVNYSSGENIFEPLVWFMASGATYGEFMRPNLLEELTGSQHNTL